MIATGAGALRSIGSSLAAQSLDERVVDDFHHHLAGFDRLDDGGADRLGARAVDEGAHDVERDVGLDERAPHFAHRGVDVLFRERAAAGQLVQYAGELFGEALEHGLLLMGSGSRQSAVGFPRSLPMPTAATQATPIAPGGATRCRTGTAGLEGTVGGIDVAQALRR